LPFRFASVALVVAATLLFACERRPRLECPDCNVVLISMDTVRADHVSAYGYARPTTPRIDALAAGGVLFENAISQSSWTRPAHMSIMTGLYPNEHGYVALVDRNRLPDDVPTLAKELAGHGWTTVAFTGGVNVAAIYGFDQGFATFRSNGKNFRDNLEETKYWLEHERKGKFFLFFHGYDAHTPYTNDAIDRGHLAMRAKRPRHKFHRVCRNHHKPGSAIQRYVNEYDGAIHHADRYVGKLVDELARLGLLEKTILVITSDHGEEFLEHGSCFHLNTVYREVVHVPLVILAPGLPPARIAATVPASVTIAPTILDMVGIRESAIPAHSLLPLALGGEAPDAPAISETSRRSGAGHGRGRGHARSLTRTNEKLVDWLTEGRREYFDVIEDPGEQRPITDEARTGPLGKEITAWFAEHPLRVKVNEQNENRRRELDESEEQLRALGYVD
jgi:arylsulfatase A-like enzyme